MTDYTALLERVGAPAGSRREVPDAAIARVKAAQPGWGPLGHAKRSELLNAAADAVDADAEALATLLSREQGGRSTAPTPHSRSAPAPPDDRDLADRPPFGGVKSSGYGLEFGVEGLESLGVPQIIDG